MTKLDIEAVKQALARMTPGPWRWWTSNSFRRLSSDPSGKDGDVAYGDVHRSDGHHDIVISEEDMRGIELLRNQGDAMVAELERLQALVKRLSCKECGGSGIVHWLVDQDEYKTKPCVCVKPEVGH